MALNFLFIFITHLREAYLKTLNLIMLLTLTQFAVICLFMISHSAYCIDRGSLNNWRDKLMRIKIGVLFIWLMCHLIIV